MSTSRERPVLLLPVSFLLLLLIGQKADGDPLHHQAAAIDHEDVTGRTQAAYFERHIRPLLALHCWKCHGEQKQEADLRLDSRAAILRGGISGPAVVAEDPDASLLVAAVRREGDLAMPPSRPLSDEEVSALAEWVAAGLPWPAESDPPTARGPIEAEKLQEEHWAFRPVVRPPVPEVADTEWPHTPIDNFILARLEGQNLSPSPPAAKRDLLRRITFDLTGLPPTLQEIESFLNDGSPDAYARVVDRLLSSPHYGERWARHWLDVVRFAETTGHEYDYDIPYVWRYRDYVVRAFNDDVPYDLFVREHIAGDLLERPRTDPGSGINEAAIATGVWWFGQQKSAPVDLRAEECDRIEDQIDVLATAFLGLSIACARCHDHKFDPVSIEDYYALAGYLKSSRRQFDRVDSPELTVKLRDLLREKKAEVQAILQERMIPPREDLSLRPNPKQSGGPVQSFAIVLAAAALVGGMIWSRKGGWSATRVVLFCCIAVASGVAILFALVPRIDEQAPGNQPPLLQTFLADSAEDFVDGFSELRNSQSLLDFSRTRERLVDRLSQLVEAAEARTTDVVFEDFDGDSYRGWYSTGEAFGTGPTAAGDFLLGESAERPIQRFLEPGVAHSGRESGRLRGSLRSEDFLVEKPYIHYRLSRRPPPDETEEEYDTGARQGQVHLIVDGLSEDLVFSDEATINADEGEQFVWYQQEVEEAWLGHRAYIQIVDQDDGFIAVDRIVFSDHAVPPPDSPGDLLIDLLDDTLINSPQSLTRAVERLFARTIDLWLFERWNRVERAADFVPILN